VRLALWFIPVCVFHFSFVFLSPLVWFFLWLPEEVLALLFVLHRENGDFSILMKDIYFVVDLSGSCVVHLLHTLFFDGLSLSLSFVVRI
jgi:hypothetical protein